MKGVFLPDLFYGKLSFVFCLSFFACSSLFAQADEEKIAVWGKVIDLQTMQPLDGIICRAYDKSEEIISYTISSEEGRFELLLKSKPDCLLFSSLGYNLLKVSYAGWLNGTIIKMEEKVFQLKEVVVRVSPITKSKDTMTYNVASFTAGEDRYLVDVLKKLPGIQVNDNGSISYQGKAINKFYIEGQDLLGNRYNQATNNLPIEAVSQIQILENNQPVKALKGMVLSDKAALNVRLKKGYKQKPFGEVAVGVGYSPLLWDARLFAARIGADNQMLATYKSNNAGTDVSDEIREHLDVSDMFSFEPFPDNLLNDAKTQLLQSFERERSLFNQSHTAGVNNLVKLSAVSFLRFNLSFLHDKRTEEELFNSIYNLSDPIYLNEQNRLVKREVTYLPSVLFEHNADRLFLSDRFSASFSKNRSMNRLISNSRDIQEKVQSSPDYFLNSLSFVLRSDKQVYCVNSYTRYVNNAENLGVLIHNEKEYEKMLQESIRGEHWISKNRLSASFLLWGETLDLGVDLNFKRYAINTDNFFISGIYGREVPVKTGSNQFAQNHYKIGLSPEYQIGYSKGVITLKLPFSLDYFTLKGNTDKAEKYFNFTPGVSIRHAFNPFLDLNGNVEYDVNYGAPEASLQNSFFRDYRTVFIPTGELDQSRSLRYLLTLKYHDMVNLLFADITGMYSYGEKSFLPDFSYTEVLSVASFLKEKNVSRLLYLNGKVDKTFTGIHLSTALAMDYSRNNFPIAQEGIVIDNSSNILSATFTLRYNPFKFISTTYISTMNMSWQSNSVVSGRTLKSLFQNLNFYVFPTTFLKFSIHLNHSAVEIEQNHFRHNLFVDADASYQLKRVEFSLSMKNLTQTRVSDYTTRSGINSISHQIPFRGREVLFSTKIKF